MRWNKWRKGDDAIPLYGNEAATMLRTSPREMMKKAFRVFGELWRGFMSHVSANFISFFTFKSNQKWILMRLSMQIGSSQWTWSGCNLKVNICPFVSYEKLTAKRGRSSVCTYSDGRWAIKSVICRHFWRIWEDWSGWNVSTGFQIGHNLWLYGRQFNFEGGGKSWS